MRLACPACATTLPEKPTTEAFRPNHRVLSYWCDPCGAYMKGYATRNFEVEDGLERGNAHGPVLFAGYASTQDAALLAA